jgi:hypothetical protein
MGCAFSCHPPVAEHEPARIAWLTLLALAGETALSEQIERHEVAVCGSPGESKICGRYGG